MSREDSARLLGYVSIGLGLAGLLAPRTLGNLIGMPRHQHLLRAVGARELTSGIGLLTQEDPTPWLWSRVVGDAMDLALLGTAMRPSNAGRYRAAGAVLAVSAIAAADIAASLSATSEKRRRSEGKAHLAHEPLAEYTVSVNKSPEVCYAFWRDVSNLAKISPVLESVQALDERRSHWVLRGPAGMKVEWDAELTADVPNERLGWHSASGALRHAGSVRFERAPGGRGTYVTAMMHYHLPGGGLTNRLAKLLGRDPNRQMREDLRRFKSLIETGEIPSTRGQSSGRRSFLGRFTRDGRESREGSKQDGAEVGSAGLESRERPRHNGSGSREGVRA